MAIFARLLHAWNAFRSQENDRAAAYQGMGTVSYHPPARTRLRISNERSIISSVYTRLSIDVASIDIRHIRLDEEGRYLEDIASGLHRCLTLEANLDQVAIQFKQDIALTLFDQGVAAIVPVDTTLDPSMGSFDIKTLRVGEIKAWHPKHVRVSVYNEEKGYREELTLEKRYVAIIENPLYSVMNEPNSTLQRLIRKLNLLDVVDEQSSSGKLDIIIQLPYAIKSEARRKQAQQRREDMEAQLMGSKYGVAYSDATEKIVQLNRPAENNLLKQVEYLTAMLYAQLGLTPSVMDGTADEKTMLNYMNRTIEPILTAMIQAMTRTFLTKTAQTQRQAIGYFRNPLKLVPLSELAEIADVLIRGEVAAANDIRVAIGWKPSKDPKADQLRNPSMPEEDKAPSEPTKPQPSEEENSQNGS